MKAWRLFKAQVALVAAGLACASPLVTNAADAYPNKPITMMIASVPGGILDVIGRIIAHGVTQRLGTVITQNISGAGGIVGTQTLLHAPANGYLLGMVATSHAINPSVYAKMPYDTVHDFITISHAVNLTNLLVVNPSVPANTVQEFIALAKSKPGLLNCGSAGTGQSNHLSLEAFNTEAGIKLVHVPYKGSAPATTDVVGGALTCMFVDALTATPLVKSGKLKALATSSASRLKELPNVPTFAESGLPNFNANSWLSLVVRSGTPQNIVDKLGEAVAQTFKDPEVRNRLLDMGIEPVGDLPGPSTRFMTDEIARYAGVVKVAGIQKID